MMNKKRIFGPLAVISCLLLSIPLLVKQVDKTQHLRGKAAQDACLIEGQAGCTSRACCQELTCNQDRCIKIPATRLDYNFNYLLGKQVDFSFPSSPNYHFDPTKKELNFNSPGEAYLDKKIDNSYISLEFYDDLKKETGFFIAVKTDSDEYRLGFDGQGSDYVFLSRYNNKDGQSSSRQSSLIERAPGWHKVEILSSQEGVVAILDGINFKFLPVNYKKFGDKFSGIRKNFSLNRKLVISNHWNDLSQAAFRVKGISVFEIVKPPEDLSLRSKILIKNYYLNLKTAFGSITKTETINATSLDQLYNLGIRDGIIKWNASRFVSEMIVVSAYLANISSPNEQKVFIDDAKELINWFINPVNENKTTFIGDNKDYSRLNLALGSWLIWEKIDPTAQKIIKETLTQRADTIMKIPPENRYIGQSGADFNSIYGAYLGMISAMFKNDSRSIGWKNKARCFAYHTYSTGDSPADTFSNSFFGQDPREQVPGCSLKTKNLFDGDKRDAIDIKLPGSYPDNFAKEIIPPIIPQKFWLTNHNLIPAVHYMLGGTMGNLAEGMIGFIRNGESIPEEFKKNVLEVFRVTQPFLNLGIDTYNGNLVGLIKNNSQIADKRLVSSSNRNYIQESGHDDYGLGPYAHSSALAYANYLKGAFDDYEKLTKYLWFFAPETLVAPNNPGIKVFAEQAYMKNEVSRLMQNSVALQRLTTSALIIDNNIFLTPINPEYLSRSNN
ncbi:hypothetical protein KBI33_03290, partial [Candidatus Shapirobacteria bacterium]|nr:hypothetical protein [Candidatus Shapirobacteria bacterium]